MPLAKPTCCLLMIASFLLGFFVSDAVHLYQQYSKWISRPKAATLPIIREEAPKPKQETFFQKLTVQEINQFDQLYDQRQVELRDIIASGSQKDTLLVPKGVFAQAELVESKIQFLANLTTYTDDQTNLRQAFLSAYQFLRAAYEKEIEFLKNFPQEGQNINFVTQHIFEISSKDQRSGLQFLDCLVTYRKLLAGAIREDQSLEKNQSRVQDLVTLNALIEKYKTRLNVPKEID